MSKKVQLRVQPPSALTSYTDRDAEVSDQKFSGIEHDCKIKLNEDLRCQIRKLQMSHLTLANLESKAVAASKLSGQAKAFSKAARKLIELLEHDRFLPLFSILALEGYARDEAYDLLNRLQYFDMRMTRLPDHLPRHGTKGVGRIPYPNFAHYVLRLAPIFQASGGNVSAAISAEAKGANRYCPFIRFVWFLAEGLPQSIRPPTISKLADAVARALRARSPQG